MGFVECSHFCIRKKTETNFKTMIPYNANNLVKTIRVEVEERQAFLDPGLTLASLADRCRTNRTYVSSALMELGGFFVYINSLRLTFAASWRKSHPGTTLEQVALASGFHCRQTYYNVRRQLEH
jgi:hypothetical protein